MRREVLLGFDLRDLSDDSAQLWDVPRRETFLLRGDVARPLSVDTLVWPSLFDSGQGIGFSDAERRRLHLAGFPLPAWTGPNAGLWERLPDMQRYLAQQASPPGPYVFVAVTWLADTDIDVAGSCGPYPADTVPSALDPAWRMLGYDVADGSQISGLSNCGYGPDEVEALRERWAPHLNDYHLFDDPGQALAFSHLTGARVAEHAPFQVYGLYRIE